MKRKKIQHQHWKTDKETFKWQFGHFILYVFFYLCVAAWVRWCQEHRLSWCSTVHIFFKLRSKWKKKHTHRRQLQKILINELKFHEASILKENNDNRIITQHRQIDQTRWNSYDTVFVLNHHRTTHCNNINEDKKRYECVQLLWMSIRWTLNQIHTITLNYIERNYKIHDLYLSNNTSFLCWHSFKVWTPLKRIRIFLMPKRTFRNYRLEFYVTHFQCKKKSW